MSLINVPVEDSREPGRIVNAWIYAEEISVNHAKEEVRITARGWNSTASAYNPASESWTRSFYFQGPEYRTLVRENPTLFTGLAGAADNLLLNSLGGGEILPVSLPDWAVI